MQNIIADSMPIWTEEERITRAECERKRRTNITEEQRLKMAENKRKQRANMTDEQRKKMAEYKRIWRANLSVEERIKRSENNRKRRANMTEEKRMKQKEYARKRKANMTEEERIKLAEIKRKWCANLTEEERRKRAEYERIRRANMSEEERRARAEDRRKVYVIKRMEKKQITGTEYTQEQSSDICEDNNVKSREHQLNMTEKRQIKRREYGRQQYAKLTEEQRLKRSEYQRKWQANMTEEERLKRAEIKREKRANMTEQERIKIAEYKRQKRVMTTTGIKKKYDMTDGRDCLNIPKERLLTNAGCNSLNKLIEKMISGNMNVEIISGLPMNLLRGILKSIGIDFIYKKKVLNYKSAIQNLTCEIDICYLIGLLRKWDGWTNSDNIKFLFHDKLFCYLKSNILNFKVQQETFIQNELYNLFDSEYFITVDCSLKQLYSLFYHSPHNYVKFYHEKNYVPSVSSQLTELLPKYIIIYPHVSTRITLPNFSMTHQNNHFDEYTLVNMTDRLNVNKNKSFFINQTTDISNSDRYLKRDIERFLNQLKHALTDEISSGMTVEKKSELTMALTIFEKDLVQCPDVIQSMNRYNQSTASYPYARYLGYSDDGDICISIPDQIVLKKSILNVRLQQIRYPNITVLLENFNVPYDVKCGESHYIFDESFLRKIDTCIFYNCSLCDESLGSCSPSQMISDHFYKYHGFEPDWECTNCIKSFTNDYLINNEWKHDCE